MVMIVKSSVWKLLCILVPLAVFNSCFSGFPPVDGEDSFVDDASPDAGMDFGSIDSVVDVVLPSLPDADFLTPEGVIAHNDRVFVASASFAYSGSELEFGAGFVTVLDAGTNQVINRIPLPFSNPQELDVAGKWLWVLCSGQTYRDSESGLVVSKSPGGLVAIDLDTADTATRPSTVIPIRSRPGSLVGYPSGMYLTGDTAWVASGTTAALFKVDLSLGQVIRGPDDPVLLGDIDKQNTSVIGQGPDGLMTGALFNSDTVFLLDPQTGEKLSSPWGETHAGSGGQISGILDIAYHPGLAKTFLLFGLANQVVSFDSDEGPAAGVEQVVAGIATPNRMKLFGDELFVVNSMGNNISSVNIETGETVKIRAVLPQGCNPWDIDIGVRPSGSGSVGGSGAAGSSNNVGTFAWVTCLKRDSVVVVDLVSGKSVEIR